MKNPKIGRTGDTIVQDMEGGGKLAVTLTPDGVVHANISNGGDTLSVDPATVGVASLVLSGVGGGLRRVTVITTNGQAIDVTESGDGSIGQVVHDGSLSREP